MKYLMLICVDESVGLSPEEMAEVQAATEAWVTEMDGSGIRLIGDRLQPVRDATHPAARFGTIEVRPFWQQ